MSLVKRNLSDYFVALSVIACSIILLGALTFALSALALIPLAGLIGRVTEDIASYTGPGLGGLINATFGNATELVLEWERTRVRIPIRRTS